MAGNSEGTAAGEGEGGVMTQKKIRELVHCAAFKPFRLHLADGKSLRVPHPEFVLAGKEQLVIATELRGKRPGGLKFVDYENVVRLEFLPKRARKAA